MPDLDCITVRLGRVVSEAWMDVGGAMLGSRRRMTAPVRIWLTDDDLVHLSAVLQLPMCRIVGRRYMGLPVSRAHRGTVSRVVMADGSVTPL